MDTSEKYINMCLKAKEINKTWSQYEADVGDMYARKHPCSDKYSPTIFTRTEADVCAVWLPRQDQLQDMINKRWTSVDFVWHLSKWANNTTSEWGANQLNSMEQLWMAYVMHKLYGKAWTGKDWVIE